MRADGHRLPLSPALSPSEWGEGGFVLDCVPRGGPRSFYRRIGRGRVSSSRIAGRRWRGRWGRKSGVAPGWYVLAPFGAADGGGGNTSVAGIVCKGGRTSAAQVVEVLKNGRQPIFLLAMRDWRFRVPQLRLIYERLIDGAVAQTTGGDPSPPALSPSAGERESI